ncbi:beta-amyrin 11-oxidase-like [Tripterygium wilfordii]|uniref:beta-amyrin 11-oxidase-like n=1 Tax=Tripterygium wilfordii TaxID=458696 RepID=UPI0018F80C4B|nr:beta-amyrin 11-oxidase-like [Tripterygium wilfordii]
MEYSSMLGLASTLIAIAFGAYVSLKRVNEWYYRSGKTKFPLPPGDMGWPLFGNMKSFMQAFKSDDPDSFLFDLVERYGRTGIYKTHLFGKPTAIVCLPETCKAVLTDDENFTIGYPSSEKLSGRKSLISVQGNEHKHLRKLTTAPINGHEALSTYVELIEEVIMAKLDEWASTSKHLELLNEFKGATFKIITNIFFGPQGYDMFGSMRSLFSDLTAGLFTMGINVPGFAYNRALKAREKLVTIVDGAIEDRRELNKTSDSKGKKSMLDFLLEVEDEDGETMDNETIIDLLAGIMFAGHESTAYATMWLLLFLYDNPEVLQKIKEEQEEIVKNRPSTQKGLTIKEIKQMPYTGKVIQELLRMTNLSFALFRETKVDVHINGYTIPKGWKVLAMARAVHMDPQIYSNPKEYDPSRWDNPNVKAGAYIPFGLGSRVCPGNDLAKLELYIFIHCFVLNYKLERTNPDCPKVHFPVPRPTDNFLAKIIKL